MIVDDTLIQGVQKIANYRIKRDYPLFSDNHFSEVDAKIIVESFLMLLGEYKEI